MGRQRCEAVHHQLRDRHLGRRDRDGCDREVKRQPPRDQRAHDPHRHAGLSRAGLVSQAGVALFGHASPELRGLRGAGRASAGSAGGWLPPVPAHVDGRAHRERGTFGVPISKHQAVQFKLADMAMETELARTMVYRAAITYMKAGAETSDEARMLAAMCKLYASEASKRAADQAVQIHGGYGFMEEYPVARYWRDVKGNEIGEGTSEVPRMVIARPLGA